MILSICPNPSIDTYAWLENFKQGMVNRIKKIQEFPGGKGVHVALALAELGTVSKLLGCWAGSAGEWIQSSCLQQGVSTSGVELSGSNRKCYTFLSEDPDFNNSELLEPGPPSNSKDWEKLKNVFKSEVSEVSLVCMSGSWPKDFPEDSYRQLIEIAKSQNTRTILDCSGRQLEEALKTGFFGLHLNQQESKNFCGSSRIEVLLEKLKNKVELVALTKGKDGLTLYYRGEIIAAKVDINNIFSSVGSGDCLTAGIAFAVEKALNPQEIARYGVACGTANCVNQKLGMLERKGVEQLLSKVEIKKLKNDG